MHLAYSYRDFPREPSIIHDDTLQVWGPQHSSKIVHGGEWKEEGRKSTLTLKTDIKRTPLKIIKPKLHVLNNAVHVHFTAQC